jgi:hypothetical protein
MEDKVNKIITVIEKHLELEPGVIHTKSRKTHIVTGRQLAHYTLKDLMGKVLSDETIGYLVGNKDRTTVIHSVKVFKNILETEKYYKQKYNDIMKEIEVYDFLECINKEAEKPESKRFKMKTLFNYHLNLYQDFNKLSFYIGASHSNDDEHNWIFGITFMFWGFEYSWNSRNIFKRK